MLESGVRNVFTVLTTDSDDDAEQSLELYGCEVASTVEEQTKVSNAVSQGTADTWHWFKDICDTLVSDTLNNADEFMADVTQITGFSAVSECKQVYVTLVTASRVICDTKLRALLEFTSDTADVVWSDAVLLHNTE